MVSALAVGESLQRAPGQHADQMALVIRRAAHIVDGIDDAGCLVAIVAISRGQRIAVGEGFRANTRQALPNSPHCETQFMTTPFSIRANAATPAQGRSSDEPVVNLT